MSEFKVILDADRVHVEWTVSPLCDCEPQPGLSIADNPGMAAFEAKVFCEQCERTYKATSTIDDK